MKRYLLYFCFMVFFSATAIAEPTITLKEASSVTTTTATLSATVNSSDWDYVEIYFQYKKINSVNFISAGLVTTITSKNTSKTISTTLKNLTPDTEYQFRVYCKNVKVGGNVYSNIGFFCTTQPHDPYLYLDEATNITYNSATLNGRILNDELGNTINWFFEYGTNSDRMTTAQQIGTWTGTGTKSVSAPISDLKEETVYYYRLRCTSELTGKTYTSVTGNFQTKKFVNVPPTGISLNKTTITLAPGSTETLKATISPSNATDKNVTWSSSNTSVASIDGSGTITAKAAGTATITATTSNGKKATCTVTVKNPTVTLNKSSLSLTIHEQAQLSATISPQSNHVLLSWSSSNTKVATVDKDGIITALSEGTTTITAQLSNGNKATCQVTVKKAEIQPTSITVQPTSMTINIGQTKQITYTLYPLNSSTTVTWSSANTSIATVSSTGVVKGIKEGTATITAKTANGLTATCKVTVNNPNVMVTSISLNANSATLSKGTTKQLTATVLPNNATNKTLEWISSNTKVATVSNTGLVTAITAGTATITCRATDGSGKSATCTITVEWPGDDTWSHVDYDLGKHGTRNVENNKSYTESVSDFSILGNIEQVKWSTKECTNIIIKEKTGYKCTYETLGIGTAKLYFYMYIRDSWSSIGEYYEGYFEINVTGTDVKVTSITLNATSATLTKGETKQLTATVSPSNATNKTVTWTSSNTSVATVNSNGLVTAVAAGTANITCTAADGSGKSATCAITVQNSGSNSGDDYWSETAKNTHTMDQNNIEIGKTVTAKVPFAEQYLPMITECKWSTKGSSNITIIDKGNNSCQIKTIKEGQCYLYNFTKFSDGDSYEIIWPIYVTAGSSTTIPVTSISLNASSASLKQGETKQLTATVSPSNATNKNVTWTSSNTSVATVSSTGLVKAVSAGTATITCTAADGSGKSATCAVTVTGADVKVTSISLNPTSATLTKGESLVFSTNIYPSNATQKDLTWSTSNTSVVKIVGLGSVTAVSPGTATIKCTARDGSGVSATCKITVIDKLDNMSVMTSSAGYATFYSSETAYTLPSHLSAQVVTNCYDNKLTFNTIADGNSGGVIPKGTAVMLVNDMKSSASFTLVPSTSTTQYTGTNYLHGSDVATTTSASGTNYYYKLTYGDAGTEYSNIFGWYWGASNGAPFFIEGHKAWLALPTSAVKRSAFFVGDVSGVNDLTIDEEEGDGLYYDMLGRPVKEPNASGVYIRNGKKVLIMK